MEQWQKDYLTAHGGRLVEETICNELIFRYLFSEGVLAKVDVERIKRTTDRYEQAALLYDFVETRENGFVGMARALAKVKQTGPLKVFMDGFARHIIPNIKMDFLGTTLALAGLFDATEMGRIIDEIKTDATLEQYVNMYDHYDQSKNTEPIKLVINKIPEENQFYVPRSLSRRLKVNPEVFKVDCLDVYAFKGIGWSKLTELVKPQRVEFSTTQLLSLSSRFIILEHEEDWEEICKTAEVPTHLIKCEKEDNGFVLEATTGGSLVIHQFLRHHHNFQSKDATISEEEFFEEVSRDGASGVCICDLPGMGKSLLLANLATRMKQQHPDRLVIFIQISHFIRFVVARKGEQVIGMLDEALAKRTFLEYLTPSHLEYFLLAELICKKTIQLELFFDGFDEVHMGQVQVAKQMLSLLSKLSNTRIFVTSRPNMRHELEASLHVISYDILPFTHANQIDFLTAFWRHLKPENGEEKLREFAEFCVVELKKKLQEKEREITGIPLQCQLVAEVFSRAANIFAQPQRNVGVQELCKIESSIADLYGRYCDVRFSKFVTSVGAVTSGQKRIRMEAVDEGNDSTSEIQEMKMFHMLHALKLLFPHYDQLFNKVLDENETATTCQLSNVMSVGILQQQFTEGHQSIQFAHRTFAEYFVAEFFAKLLAGEMEKTSDHQQLIQLFFLEVIEVEVKHGHVFNSTFTHSVILYFFNSACAKMRSNSNDELLLKTFASSMDGDRLYYVLYCTIKENLADIFLLLKNLLSKVDAISLNSYKSRIVDFKKPDRVSSLIFCAAEYSTVSVVEQLFHLFREYFQIDPSSWRNIFLVHSYCSDMDENPLGAAIIRSTKLRVPNYEMIRFFAVCAPTGRCLLHRCISNSQDMTPLEIERLLSILNWLLEKYKNLVPPDSPLLVYSFNVHVDVIKLLLRNGVDPRTADNGKTVVHRGSQSLDGKDFAELCLILIHEFNAADLFDNVEGRWTSPLSKILAKKRITNETIQMIYDVPWLCTSHETGRAFEASTHQSHQRIRVDINYSDESGCTLLMCAVQGKRGTCTIARMIDNGANVLAQDEYGSTFVHYVARYYKSNYSPKEYHEFVKLLIDKQLGRIFQVSNKFGRTPLHDAVKCIELLPETLDLLVSQSQNTEQPIDNTHSCYVNLNAVDEDGTSILYEAVHGKRSLPLIKHLIGIGADWSIKTKYNRNLAHASASEGLLDHLKFFVELGCDINAVNTDSNNALQCAITRRILYDNRLLEIVQFLVSNGARKENTNKKGETAYMIAVRERANDSKILELLK